MIGVESILGNLAAASSVGWVLVEAIILYFGYGVLTRVAGPTVKNAVIGE